MSATICFPLGQVRRRSRGADVDLVGSANRESGCSAIATGGVPAKPAVRHRVSGAIRKTNRDNRIGDNRVSDWRLGVSRAGLPAWGWGAGAAGSLRQTDMNTPPAQPVPVDSRQPAPELGCSATMCSAAPRKRSRSTPPSSRVSLSCSTYSTDSCVPATASPSVWPATFTPPGATARNRKTRPATTRTWSSPLGEFRDGVPVESQNFMRRTVGQPRMRRQSPRPVVARGDRRYRARDRRPSPGIRRPKAR